MSNTTLIAGASSGIGMEMARLFAKEGHGLLITNEGEAPLNNLFMASTENNYY